MVSGFDPTVLMCEDRDEDGETASLLFPLFPEPELYQCNKPVLSDFSLLSHSENLGSLNFQVSVHLTGGML